MENASKALLMACGILLGILILTLTVTVFASSKNLSDSYEQTKRSEAIQQFNANFTKYLGQELTIHQVVTICNFAKIENNKIHNVSVKNQFLTANVIYTKDNIKTDIGGYTPDNIKTYTLEIRSYSPEGYIDSISIY